MSMHRSTLVALLAGLAAVGSTGFAQAPPDPKVLIAAQREGKACSEVGDPGTGQGRRLGEILAALLTLTQDGSPLGIR